MKKFLTFLCLWASLLLLPCHPVSAQIQGCVLPDVFAPAVISCDETTLYALVGEEFHAQKTLRFALDAVTIQEDSALSEGAVYLNVITSDGTNGWVEKNCLAIRGEGGVMRCNVAPGQVEFEHNRAVAAEEAFYAGEPIIRLDRGNNMIYVTNSSNSKKGWVDISCLLEGETEIFAAILMHDALRGASVCEQAEKLKGLREDQRFEYTHLAPLIHDMYAAQSAKCFTETPQTTVSDEVADNSRGLPPASQQTKPSPSKPAPTKAAKTQTTSVALSEKPVATQKEAPGKTRSLPPKTSPSKANTPKTNIEKPQADETRDLTAAAGKASSPKEKEADKQDETTSKPASQPTVTVFSPTSAPILANRETIGKDAQKEVQEVREVRNKYSESLKLVQVVEPQNTASIVYTCYHPSLPLGAHLAVKIPNNEGFMEFVVVGRLSKHHGLGLNKVAIDRLFGATPPTSVDIEYFTLEEVK